jgi:FKBP-type peptidyl-prolyl cis-trans isomerase SlyD
MVIEKNKIVSIHYQLKDAAGNVLQGNEGYTPEVYLHGAKQLLPALEKALEGKKQNETIQVVIPPDQAYGSRQAHLMVEFSLDDLEDPAAITVGDFIPLQDGLEGLVIDKNETHFMVDANHALAGETLFFTIKISDIRNATPAEIANRMPAVSPASDCCGPAGCC